MKNLYVVALVALSCLQHLHAQPSIKRIQNNAAKTFGAGSSIKPEIFTVEKMPSLASLRFSGGKGLRTGQTIDWLKTQSGFRPGKDELIPLTEQFITVKDIRIERWQQYYKGIKVEHGIVVISAAGNTTNDVQLELYPVPDSLQAQPAISETVALSKAIAYARGKQDTAQNAGDLQEQGTAPKGELVWVEDIFKKRGNICLAYKFLIIARDPLTKSFIYVNAESGAIVFDDAVIKHVSGIKSKQAINTKAHMASPSFNVSGSVQTMYSGSQNILTDQRDTSFHLRAKRNEDSIITLNYQRRVKNGSDDELAIDFSDQDNNWSAAEFDNANLDHAALDAHFGLQKVSDYWNLVHGRKGWDNFHTRMLSYVHIRVTPNSGYDNAYWDGISMNYGDGTYYDQNPNGYLPLTSLDITAHEMGHGVCQSTANLAYQRESGALNEGFSDIWAACIEHYSGLGGLKQNFLIGEEVFPAGAFLRNMANPNERNSPDTYNGSFWRNISIEGCPVWYRDPDNCGVHINSSVLSKWFFLITQGEISVNDFGNRYAIYGLGFEKSERIAYLTELLLTPNADYAAAREASISAATTLFGACSNEVQQVTNAWYAVGVGSGAACFPSIEFAEGLASITENSETINSCTSKTFNIPVRLALPASAKVTLTFNMAGNAITNMDYILPSRTLSFEVGESGIKNLPITILDDATIDGPKVIQFSFSVDNGGGNASAGPNNQVFTLNITDDDLAPVRTLASPIATSPLINENFEITAGRFPAGWSEGIFSGGQSVNRFVVGDKGGPGISGKAAYITNDPFNRPLAYSDTSATQRFLSTKPISTINLTNLKLSFTCKVNGEFYPDHPLGPNLFDYASIVYSTNGINFPFLIDPVKNAPYAFYDHGNNAFTVGPISLPSFLNGRPAVYLGFCWTNDAAVANKPPLLIDDVIVTGQTLGSSIQTRANEPGMARILGGVYNSYIYSTLDSQLIARVSDASQHINCLTGVIKSQGNGKIVINGIQPLNGTQKVIELDAGPNNNTNTTHTVHLYYTSDELATWGPAKTQLKILKVKSGVSLSSNLTSADVQLVTPNSVVDNSATTGTIIYSGSFTGFSQYLLVDPLFALPVTLKELSVRAKGKDAILSWETEAEINNKGFEILRSYDGIQFEKIGFVYNKGTNGSKYEFIDFSLPSNIKVQYRLNQVDLDQRSMLSEIVSTQIGTVVNQILTISPNPVSASMRVSFPTKVNKGKIVLLTPEGRVVREFMISSPMKELVIDAGAITPGIYFARYSDGARSETVKFLKK